jgi:hypothetical protein
MTEKEYKKQCKIADSRRYEDINYCFHVPVHFQYDLEKYCNITRKLDGFIDKVLISFKSETLHNLGVISPNKLEIELKGSELRKFIDDCAYEWVDAFQVFYREILRINNIKI